MSKKKLNNKGFAVSAMLYTLLTAFLLFLGASLAQFSSSAKILSNANKDLTDGFGYNIFSVYYNAAGGVEEQKSISIHDFPYKPDEPSIAGKKFKNFKSFSSGQVNKATLRCGTLSEDSALPVSYSAIKNFSKRKKCAEDIKIEYKADFEENISEYKIQIIYINDFGGDELYENTIISSDSESIDINRNINSGYEINNYWDYSKSSSDAATLSCGGTDLSVQLPISYNTLKEKCTRATGTLKLRVVYKQINLLDNVDVNVYYWFPRYSNASSGFLNEISGTCGLYYSKSRVTNIYKTVKLKDLTIGERNNVTNNYWTLKGCNAKFTLKDTNENYYNSPTSYGCDPERYIKPEIEKLYNQNSKPQLSSIDLYVRSINDDSSCGAP